MWQPVRRPLGITAFGINAYTAGKAGDEVVEDHTEQTHEEAYIVIRGHATFTVEEEEIDVYCWRMEELIRAGYSWMAAGTLADRTDIDLHAACRLRAVGCPDETAVSILT